MPRTWTIARREFLSTARTKGFVIGTLFGPAILAGWILLPALFAEGGGTREIVVIDGTRSGLGDEVAAQLVRDAEGLAFSARVVVPAPGTADSVRAAMAARAAAGEIDGSVWLPPGLPVGESASYEARHSTNMREVGAVRSAVDDAVRQARLRAAGIDPTTLSDTCTGLSCDCLERIIRAASRAIINCSDHARYHSLPNVCTDVELTTHFRVQLRLT